jgi:hypothetical protein
LSGARWRANSALLQSGDLSAPDRSDQTSMTLVPCPACQHPLTDPGREHTCPSCGQKLTFESGPAPVAPAQLGLFDDATAADGSATGGTPARRSPLNAPDSAGRSGSVHQGMQDALAAVTELFHSDELSAAESIAGARALFTDHPAADLQEAALGAAWFAATCLRAIEEADPGAGFEMLEGFGITLAQHDD